MKELKNKYALISIIFILSILLGILMYIIKNKSIVNDKIELTVFGQ